MKPVPFKEANRELQSPGCDPLPTFTDCKISLSKWRLTTEEIDKLQHNGGYLWLWVMSGETQPPVAITVEHPFDTKLP